MEEISRDWLTFLQMPFPKNCRGSEIENTSLNSLVDTSLDCLSHFLRWNGSLAKNKCAKLEDCMRIIQIELPNFDEHSRQYFLYLLRLSQMAMDYQENITEEELARRQRHMRYFRITMDEEMEWGRLTYWFEINELGHAERQIDYYSNGNSLSYDQTHEGDDCGGLQEMVVDGDEEYWGPYTISKEAFEREWISHIRMNRDAAYKERLDALWPKRPTIERVDDLPDIDDNGIPF